MNNFFKFIHFRPNQFPTARMTTCSPLALAISPRLMATTPAAAEISSKQLRKIFLEFFISADGHRILPSAVLNFDPYRVKVIFKLNINIDRYVYCANWGRTH
jgi:hypothetical protein